MLCCNVLYCILYYVLYCVVLYCKYCIVSPDVVVQLCLKVCPPGVAVLYPGAEPVAGLLLAPLGLAGAVGHESVRLISDPLRLCAGRVSPAIRVTD